MTGTVEVEIQFALVDEGGETISRHFVHRHARKAVSKPSTRKPEFERFGHRLISLNSYLILLVTELASPSRPRGAKLSIVVLPIGLLKATLPLAEFTEVQVISLNSRHTRNRHFRS